MANARTALQPYNIGVVRKPMTTLRWLITNVKEDKPEDRQGEVYKIKCCDCQATSASTIEVKEKQNSILVLQLLFFYSIN